MEITKKPILKEVYTNPLYQSTFMPIFEKAEIKIKELIFAAFFFGKNKYLLRISIAAIINDVASKIPNDLRDRDVYLNALSSKSEFMIRQYYDKPQTKFQEVKETIMGEIPFGEKAPILESPKETISYIKKRRDLWSAQKGSPNVVNYEKELKVKLNQLAAEPITTQEPGKKPISLWQKAELDVRYENQMQKLQDLRVQGVDYAWLSTHPNCSKRCSAWQGELVALEGHAQNPQTTVDYKTFKYNKTSFLMGKVDGHKVYSLPDIMNVVDSKYGYHNNIVCGFNCRHRLVPYQKGSTAPKEYTKEELAEQRQIEAQIRDLERQIRLKKKQLRLYNELGDKKSVATLQAEIKRLTAYYKQFCERNGYAWHKYRIDI